MVTNINAKSTKGYSRAIFSLSILLLSSLSCYTQDNHKIITYFESAPVIKSLPSAYIYCKGINTLPGSVIFSVTVGQEGAATQLKMVKPVPNSDSIYISYFYEYIKNIEFESTLQNGKPVTVGGFMLLFDLIEQRQESGMYTGKYSLHERKSNYTIQDDKH